LAKSSANERALLAHACASFQGIKQACPLRSIYLLSFHFSFLLCNALTLVASFSLTASAGTRVAARRAVRVV